MPDGVSLTGVNEFCIRVGKKSINLQATTADIANEWYEAINEWVLFLSSGD
jgi:hypothetical protein